MKLKSINPTTGEFIESLPAQAATRHRRPAPPWLTRTYWYATWARTNSG